MRLHVLATEVGETFSGVWWLIHRPRRTRNNLSTTTSTINGSFDDTGLYRIFSERCLWGCLAKEPHTQIEDLNRCPMHLHSPRH